MTEPDYDDDLYDDDGNLIEGEDDEPKQEPSALRSAVKRANTAKKKAVEERDTLRKENAVLKAGLADLDGVKVKALLAAHEGDLSPDTLRATAVSLGFAPAPDTSEADAKTAEVEASATAQAGMSAAVNGAKPGEGGLIDGETYASWPMDKRLQFAKDHPLAMEQLRRGETVPAVAGY